MNLLLDTHALLWWLDDNPALSDKAKIAIADGRKVVFISAAVIWEIRIKHALGKLIIPGNFYKVLKNQSFEMLDITVEHANAIGSLPDHHKDPFDRMLVAQAKIEKLSIVTGDLQIKKYNVPIIKT